VAEIRHRAANFSFGRAPRPILAAQRLACAEIRLRRRVARVVPSDGGF
jgi:hypothetical protein